MFRAISADVPFFLILLGFDRYFPIFPCQPQVSLMRMY